MNHHINNKLVGLGVGRASDGPDCPAREHAPHLSGPVCSGANQRQVRLAGPDRFGRQPGHQSKPAQPVTSRSLKTLTRSWSDLALACLIHVGMKRLMPDEDSGLGIGAEYEEAVRWLNR